MDLVGYSDSEGSEDEKPQPNPTKTIAIPPANNSNFAVNKTNPRKIQVRLADTNGPDVEEPAAKRPRVGAGTFSGFNSLLPPPKRDADAKTSSKPAARKVFSLKTGAEPGFSRESDAELRNLFAEDQDSRNGATDLKPEPSTSQTTPSGLSTEQPVKGNAFMFKPLSVARGKKQKKPAYALSEASTPSMPEKSATSTSNDIVADPIPPPQKISLFSIGATSDPKDDAPAPDFEDDDPGDDLNGVDANAYLAEAPVPAAPSANAGAQSLDSIASDLNLSEADRRQLFGRRKGQQMSDSAVNVVNFNTDQEYAANEVLRASGEQVQHNPVRAIASGKHSLKQLVSAATNQKDALEESFATGRKNKKEAGSKYGW